MHRQALYLGSLYWLKLVIHIFLYFLAVDDVNICFNRGKLRVEQGGHNVNPDVIKLRYTTGLALLKHFKDFPDVLILLDNRDSIAKTELELRKGVVHYQCAQSREWVTTMVEEKQSMESLKETKSIHDEKKLYKKGKASNKIFL